MKKGIYLCASILFSIFSLILSSSFVYGSISETERAALIALYNSTDGDNWTENYGWKTPPLDSDGFSMPGSEHEWVGIEIVDDSVVDIALRYNNLSGTLPPEIGNLSNMERLWIDGNQLSGIIPPEIGNLLNLYYLKLGENHLSGSIPPEIGNILNLSYLKLDSNLLSGTIPVELGNLINLELLWLNGNQLMGCIPDNITNLSVLEDDGGLLICDNYLYTDNESVSTFIDKKSGGEWESCQLTIQNGIMIPKLVTPLNGASYVSLTPKLQTGPFIKINSNDTHLKTDWQISESEAFSSSILYEKSFIHLTSLVVPGLTLRRNTTYYWRVRFYDNNANVSEWSEPFSFTTLETPNDFNENGIPDILENTSVDLDNDGTPDIETTDRIKSLNTVVGNGQMGASIKDSVTITSIQEIDSLDPDDISKILRPEKMPLGLFSIRLAVTTPGDAANVIVYFSEAAPANAVWYFYDSINGWVDYSEHSTFSEDRKSISLDLKDGDYGDADGVENGIIVDPSGFGIASWIQGFVSDLSTNSAITTATVFFDELDLSLNTLLDGNYLTMILPGTYYFSISAQGYVTHYFSNVEVSEAGIVTKDAALLPLITQTQVSQLYVSIFGRASEGEGNCYWQENQTDMTIAANTMLATDAAKSYFGTTLNDNQQFIEFIYENTLGKTYAQDPTGVDYWVNELAKGKSKGQVVATLINAAMDPLYKGLPAQNQFINKVTVCNYTADNIYTVPDVNDLSAFVEFISNVTDDMESVEIAQAAVDDF